MEGSANPELTVHIFKHCVSEADVISVEFFGSNRRRYSRGTHETPDVRRLYSQAGLDRTAFKKTERRDDENQEKKAQFKQILLTKCEAVVVLSKSPLQEIEFHCLEVILNV